ncbi:hypothetical protein KM043_015248 [Ampulex compressa]|nr:hypothetical protein KM043_015248 [Ampulex compressa]
MRYGQQQQLHSSRQRESINGDHYATHNPILPDPPTATPSAPFPGSRRTCEHHRAGHQVLCPFGIHIKRCVLDQTTLTVDVENESKKNKDTPGIAR